MTLQSSGAITLADIAAEFGGDAPHSLSEYYAGGANVPSGIAGIPISGSISLSDFYGTSNYVLWTGSGNVRSSSTESPPPNATFTMYNTGGTYKFEGGSAPTTWVTPTGAGPAPGNLFEMKWIETGSSGPGAALTEWPGTENVWQDMDVSRTWRSAGGQPTATLRNVFIDIYVRFIAGSAGQTIFALTLQTENVY